MVYVYFLRLNDATIYKGLTTRLKERYNEHRLGKVHSTKHKRPLLLIGYEAYMCKSDAERRERFLKTTDGRCLLRQQYRDALNESMQHLSGIV